jgi:urea transport system permease protein
MGRNWVGVARIFFAFLAVIAASASVRASDFDAEVVKLGSDELDTVTEAIAALAGAEDPRALAALTALREGKLAVSADGVVVVLREGKATGIGAASTGTAPYRAVAMNNALRRALSSAIPRLELVAGDEPVRRSAATRLAASPDASMLPLLRRALAKEPLADIRHALALAAAQLDLESGDVAARLAAARLLSAEGTMAYRPLFERRLQRTAAEGDAAVRAALEDAINTIEQKELVTRVASDLMYGLSLGSVLLLAALGLAITFGLMGVINMAHGEMLMIGAYATYVVQLGFAKYLPAQFDWYVLAALPAAFGASALAGVLVERCILRFLYGRPLETLLATWGVSLGLIQTVRLLFGAQNVAVPAPRWLSGGLTVMEGVVLPYNRLATVVFGGLVVAFVWLILSRTRLGLNVRAVTQNRGMAGCMGIRTAHVDMWTFGMGSGVAGLGGVALSQIGNVGPELGQTYIVDSFMVVVLGGVGKLAGTVAGAFGLGIVNKLLEPISGAVLGKIIVLGLIILFIQKRPQGIFALKGRAVEA